MLTRISPLALALAILVAGSISSNARPRLYRLPAPRGTASFQPVDLSTDGQFLVSAGETRQQFNLGYLQTRRGRSTPIVRGATTENFPVAISADGATVLGNTLNAAGWPQPFVWHKDTGVRNLSFHPDYIVTGSGLSGNGRVVVGRYRQIRTFIEFVDQALLDKTALPFVWTVDGGFRPLSTPKCGRAQAASHDGQIIAGSIITTNYFKYNQGPDGEFACRWINQGEPERLVSTLFNNRSDAITPDGRVIIGHTYNGYGTTRYFRWRVPGLVEWILEGSEARPFTFGDVSDNGAKMVGSFYGNVAVIWTAGAGLQDLNAAYAAQIPKGWRLQNASTISGDGRWIAGTMSNTKGANRGFLLDTGTQALLTPE